MILGSFLGAARQAMLALRFILLLLVMSSSLVSNASRAQAETAPAMWKSSGGPSGTYASAQDACRAQWKYYMSGSKRSRFIGAFPNANDWTRQGCKWTRYTYLCHEETGGGIIDCGTISPTFVTVSCPSGFSATADGYCRKNAPKEQPCKCDDDGRVNPTTPHPVVLSTGAKILDAVDYASADGNFSIGRRYRSFQVGSRIDGVILPRSLPRGLASSWNLDFGYEIQLGNISGAPATPSAKVAILAPDGTGFGFVLQSSGLWVPDPAAGAANAPVGMKLEFVGTLPADLADLMTTQSNWKLTDSNDTVWTLQTQADPNGGRYVLGWPVQKSEREGYSWNFAYNPDSSLASVTDSYGRTATFSWHNFRMTTLATPPAGSLPTPEAIAAISLPDGTSLRYTYDPAPAPTGASTGRIERLVKVERLSAANAVLDSTTYLYENPTYTKIVTGVVDHRGVRTKTIEYDDNARAISSTLADGTDPYTIQYGVNGTAQTRRVVNGLGKAKNYTFAAFTGAGPLDYRLTQVAGEASANTPTDTASLTFDTNTFQKNRTDPEGRTTVTTRDARGRPTTIVEANGNAAQRTTTMTWHPTFNVPASVVRPGMTETYTYTATGQLETVTQTDTTSQTVPYSTNGQARTWTYAWNANGRMLSLNGPLAADGSADDLTSYTYDTAGNLLTATNALGHVTTFAGHDANGRPGTMTDANGVVTAYTYDGLGRVTALTVQHPTNTALNATTTIAYDAIGQITQMTLPSTDTLLMDYDGSGRVTSMRAASGERWDFTYDAMGNVSRETVKRTNGSLARQVTRAFDELGRLISETTATGHTSRWSYDKVGNVVADTSPNGNATTAAFDALDRVVTTVAPDNGTSGLAYDAQDNLTTYTDPIAVSTTFTYNGFGEVIREVSPDRGTNTYWYDAAGQMIQSSDGRGQVIDYTRDYLGRVTSKVPQGRPSSETVQYVWDTGGLSGSYAIGRLGKLVDGTGETLFRYDHRGNLSAQQQTIGATTGALLAFERDLANRITQVTYPSGRIVQYGYDSKGRVNLVQTKASAATGSWTTIANSYAYEPFGPASAMALGNGLAVANDWGSEGRLVSRRLYRTSNGTDLSNLAYRYDADGNITAITDQVTPASSVVYGYDKVGRLSLALTSNPTGSAETYALANGTNRLATLTNSSGTRTFAYDDRGNTAAESRPGGVSVSTAYDGYGRLIQYNRSNVDAFAFAYNGRDDRVTMVRGIDTRRFVYDPEGRVLGEYGNSAADVKAEFIWASPEASNDNAFGGGDGTGGYAPLAVATPDLTGAIQINWVHGNHLGVPLVTTDSAGNPAATPNDYFAPGFPGQSRILPDLYYNRYRDYDPTTGRYIQADPIGLDGGSNNYEYVGGNPVNRMDQLGLAATIPNPPPDLPGGPFTPKPPTPGNRPGSYLGPKQPGGGRAQAQWVPAECDGGPPGSKGYWKVQMPGEKGWKRYGTNSKPLTPEEAHPNPKKDRTPPQPIRKFGFAGPAGALICLLFCESPAY